MPVFSSESAEPGGNPVVSVLIVNFNSGTWLERCVASVMESDIAVEVLVGDNGSSDESVNLLMAKHGSSGQIRLFEFGRNLGFAKAVNRLLDKASASHLLLLNPDCVVQPDTLRRMLAEMRADPACGMAGCLIRNPDGTEQRGCRRTIPNLQSSFARSLPPMLPAWLFGKDAASSRGFDLAGTELPVSAVGVEAISGAFMLLSRNALEKVGPMDEAYFLHCEDLDWCLRFALAGYKILFVPGVEILHAQGVCSDARPIRVEWHKHRGMLRFFGKFYGEQHGVLYRLLVAVAIAARFAVVCGALLRRR